MQYPGSMSLSSLICWTASSAAGRASAVVHSMSLLANRPTGKTTLPSLPHSVEARRRQCRKMTRQNTRLQRAILMCLNPQPYSTSIKEAHQQFLVMHSPPYALATPDYALLSSRSTFHKIFRLFPNIYIHSQELTTTATA